MMVVNLILIAACAMAGGEAQENTADVIAPGRSSRSSGARGASPKGARWPATASILFSDIGDRIMRFDPATGDGHRLPRAERPGQRPDLRPAGPADRRRGGEHRRRPAGLDHRARRHGPHPGRPLPGEAVQQPQRRRRRSPRAGSTSPTPATSATSPASSISRPSSGSTPTARSPASRRRPLKPNGLAVSPDGKTLYVADNGPQAPGPAGARPRRRRRRRRTPASSTTSATAGASTA